jgi:hypothetical protein
MKFKWALFGLCKLLTYFLSFGMVYIKMPCFIILICCLGFLYLKCPALFHERSFILDGEAMLSKMINNNITKLSINNLLKMNFK